MHANQTHPHYSPSWVGGLMDPVFLRHAVNDAEGERHSEDDPPPMARVAWLVTARGVALRILRRSTGR